MSFASAVHAVLKASPRPLKSSEIATAIGKLPSHVSGKMYLLLQSQVAVRLPDGTYAAGPVAPRVRPGDEGPNGACVVSNRWVAMQQLLHCPLPADELAELLDVPRSKVPDVLSKDRRAGRVVFADGAYHLTDAGRAHALAEG